MIHGVRDLDLDRDTLSKVMPADGRWILHVAKQDQAALHEWSLDCLCQPVKTGSYAKHRVFLLEPKEIKDEI